MKLDSLAKLYVHELKNLYSGERQCDDALTELIAQAKQPDLRRALAAQRQTADVQTQRLEQVFDGVEFSPGGQKCRAVGALIKTVKTTIADARNAVARDQAVWLGWRRLNSYLASGYRLAQDQAARLGRDEDVKLLGAAVDDKIAADAALCEVEQPVERLETGQNRSQRSGSVAAWVTRLPLSTIARVALLSVGSCLIIMSLLSLLPLPAWWVRVFDFPRVQIAVLAGLTLVGYGFLLRRRWPDLIFVTLLVATVGFQFYWIYPYTVLATTQVKPSAKPLAPRFRLMVANVLTENRNAAGLVDIAESHRPDLLLLLETDRRWVDEFDRLYADEAYPYAKRYPLSNTYGMALYSRLPLIDPQVRFLIQDDVPSIHTRFALASGVEVELYALHPRPPSPTEHYRSTERDAELLLVGKAVENARRPVVVAGDMNDVAWSRTTNRFQRISGLLDPRIGRGIYSTFHAGYPLLRWPLDHVFHSEQLRLVEMRQLPYFGSDHFPILITLSYEPDLTAAQNEPQDADREDREEARETIDEAQRDN